MERSEKWKINSKWFDRLLWQKQTVCWICYWTESRAGWDDSTPKNSSANVFTVPAKTDTSAVLQATLCWRGEWRDIKEKNRSCVKLFERGSELKQPSVLCNCSSNLMLWLSGAEVQAAFHGTSTRNTSTGQEIQIGLEMTASWARNENSAKSKMKHLSLLKPLIFMLLLADAKRIIIISS